jgi:hypothetical protein
MKYNLNTVEMYSFGDAIIQKYFKKGFIFKKNIIFAV